MSLDYTARDAILPRVLELHPVPHATLARVCIAHLVSCGLQNYQPEADTEDRLADFYGLLYDDVLLAYAFQSWIHHARHCSHYPPVFDAVSNLVLNATSFPLDGDFDDDFGGPLHIAAAHGLEDLILPAARLQSPNTRTENSQRSPLYLAIEHRRLACAKSLLSLPGIDVNVPDYSGWTPLMHAAAHGHVESIQLLLEASGIDINACNGDRETALMLAARDGQSESAKLLIGLPGIDVNVKDKYGWTPLIHAAVGGHTGAVKELLNAQQIDVNAACTWTYFGWDYSKSGYTALMMAAYRGHIEIVQHLLAAPGIDVNVGSQGDQTALSIASAEGHTEIVDLLLAIPGILS